MTNPDDIVGHKTFAMAHGGFRHEPLTRAEADAFMALAEAAVANRAASYPTAQDAVTALWAAYQRLKELGWKEACYAKPDSKMVSVITLGSTGIHTAYCESAGPMGQRYWWHPSHGDLWPIEPILYLDDDPAPPNSDALVLLDGEPPGP